MKRERRRARERERERKRVDCYVITVKVYPTYICLQAVKPEINKVVREQNFIQSSVKYV